MAGVIKMVMAMRHGVLPKTLHVEEPSGQIDWSAGSVSLLGEAVPWPQSGQPRRAGVSSFGISGTNAHVIFEQAPPVESHVEGGAAPALGGRGADSVDDGGGALPVLGGAVAPWVLSAKSGAALRGQAGRLREHVAARAALGVDDVGLSLAASRSAFAHRAVAVGERERLLSGLDGLVAERSLLGLVEGVASERSGGVVFLFPGQGSQWTGMALELLEGSPVFAERMSASAAALAPFVDWSLEAVLRGEPDAPGLERVDVVQPALFAVTVSLAELWRACGVRPAVVVGHSQGEIAAAHVAGGLSLEDAARLVALRSRLLVGLIGRGGMVSVAAGAGEVEGRLEHWGGRVGVAAVNGPGSVVVSGEREALDGFLAQCRADGVRAREIPVDYASHSAQIEEIRMELLDVCSGVTPRSGEVPFFSTVVNGLIDTGRAGWRVLVSQSA